MFVAELVKDFVLGKQKKRRVVHVLFRVQVRVHVPPPPVLRTNLHSYNIFAPFLQYSRAKFRAISSRCFMDNQRNGLETQATGLVTSVLRPDTHYFGMKARATIRSKKWGIDSKIRTSWECFSNFLKHLTLNQYFQILKAHLI